MPPLEGYLAGPLDRWGKVGEVVYPGLDKNRFGLFEFPRVVQHVSIERVSLMIAHPRKLPVPLANLALGWASVFVALVPTVSGCGVIKEKPKSEVNPVSAVSEPMSSEKAKAVLGEVGSNFVYGPGIGDAAVNLGAVIVFPPYLVYLLGNTALSLSGYQPVTVSSLLPEESGKAWSNSYDTVVSGPGRLVAAAAGHEYRTQEVADERLRTILAQEEPSQNRAQLKGN